jgi:hypothetical protein
MGLKIELNLLFTYWRRNQATDSSFTKTNILKGMKWMTWWTWMEPWTYGDANEPTKMDMNTVMYPEISREAPMMMHGNQAIWRWKMDMKEWISPPTMASTDITTLNWRTCLLTASHHLAKKRGSRSRIAFWIKQEMNRYLWSMDNKVLSETDKIYKKKEKMFASFYNNSMMRHQCTYMAMTLEF